MTSVYRFSKGDFGYVLFSRQGNLEWEEREGKEGKSEPEEEEELEDSRALVRLVCSKNGLAVE
jgi:hypothetical protein